MRWALTLDASGRRLYVAQDNADQVAVIDNRQEHRHRQNRRARSRWAFARRRRSRREACTRKERRYPGAGTFTVTLSPDGQNALRHQLRLELDRRDPIKDKGMVGTSGTSPTPMTTSDRPDSHRLRSRRRHLQRGRLPGSMSFNGKQRHRAQSRAPHGSTAALTEITYPGGNAAPTSAARASNQYQFQLERASLVAAPVPDRSDLPGLTAPSRREQTSTRPDPEGERAMAFLRRHIKHVIYIIQENRTFDQVLGDLDNGAQVDSSITQFPRRIHPSLHGLTVRLTGSATCSVNARQLQGPGDGSMDGWSWSLQGRVHWHATSPAVLS